jgi:hypothetical protein
MLQTRASIGQNMGSKEQCLSRAAAHPVGAEAGRLPYDDDGSQQQHTVVLVRKVPTLQQQQCSTKSGIKARHAD